MSRIEIEGIQVFAYHGCLPEETRIGGNYTVDVRMETDFTKASKSDRLKDTIDYCAVAEIVQQEMAIPSRLIESVAKRILDKLKKRFPMIRRAEIKVTKHHPPISGEVEKVSIVICE